MAEIKASNKLKIADNVLSCFDDFIGVRNGCDDEYPDSGLFLDDIEGINLLNAADSADSMTLKGSDLLQRAIQNGTSRTISDFVSQLSKPPSNLQFTPIKQDSSIKMAGDYEWSGGKWFSINVTKLRSNKHERLCVFDFGLMVSDSVGCKPFILQTDREEKTAYFDLVKGYNKLNISVNADTEWIRIKFLADDFEVGRKSGYRVMGDGCLIKCYPCADKCAVVECQVSDDCEEWESVSDYFGFDLCVQCKCDIRSIACYFRSELAQAIQYKAAISYFLEVKATDRINHYTENGKKLIDEMLLKLNGGIDMTTGIKEHSDYWRALTGAVNQVRASLPNIKSSCFSCYASSVVGDSGLATNYSRRKR